MSRELTYTTKAVKGLKKMPKPQALKMINALKTIADDKGYRLDIKKLQGMAGYRVRIGQYRAIYSLDMVVMTVENVAPRGSIY
jgi:mRNA interferase RelE/StbE